MQVAVKRVYEKPTRRDGKRVLVDRLWPRGLTKEAAALHQWLRELAPSDELRIWFHAHPSAWPAFRKQYLKELADPQATQALAILYELTGKGKVTLLFASKNEDHNNATVLKELLEGARKPPTGTGPAAAGAARIRQAARARR